MSVYFVRIEVHDLPKERYDELHRSLKAKGFIRYFPRNASAGKTEYYQLPSGMYRCTELTSVEISININQVFKSLRKSGEFIAIERKSIKFDGLTELTLEEAKDL